MANAEQEVGLKVHLPGLVEIFGNHLYGEFAAIVRELVQNGHDAIVENVSNEHDINRNRVDTIFRDDSCLVINDTGRGLSRSELEEDLNNFARSSKAQIQEKVKPIVSKMGLQIIGQYGVGFLSAMAVSETLEVWSKPAPDQAYLWSYNRGSSTALVREVSVTEVDRLKLNFGIPTSATGTMVVCHLTQEIRDQYTLSEDYIEHALKKYTKLLRISIYLNGARINPDLSGWADPARATEADWKEAIVSMGNEEPLFIMPVYSPPTELDAQGVLWIPPRSTLIEDYYIDVYVKRMFVESDMRVIMPSWARFIRGMINSNKIQRIVSGNTFEDDSYAASGLKSLVIGTINEGFRKLRSYSDDEYWRIIGPHDDTIKESAADNLTLMNEVWDKMRLRARSRRVTIPEYVDSVYRATGKNNILYFNEYSTQEFSANLVSDATGIPVLSLTDRKDYYFTSRVAATHKLEMLSFRSIAESFFLPPDTERDYEPLIRACAENNIAADIRKYEPPHVPAVLIEDKDIYERRDELLEAVKKFGEKRIVDDLAKVFTRERAANSGVSFYLNSDNELIKSLINAPFDAQVDICRALYHISYMSAMPELRRAETQVIYSSICDVLMDLLRQISRLSHNLESPVDGDVEAPRSGNAGLPPAVSESDLSFTTKLFVMMPFDEAYQGVEEAIRAVFSGPPFFFEVVLARDVLFESKLLDSLRVHMQRAHGFVADITELTPNVMFEIGAALIMGKGRPVFSLRGRQAKSPVPADLRSELFIPYGSPSDDVSEIADAIKNSLLPGGKVQHRELKELLQHRRERALSSVFLANIRCRLSSQEINDLIRTYSSIEALMNTADTDVGTRLRMSPRNVGILKAAILEETGDE